MAPAHPSGTHSGLVARFRLLATSERLQVSGHDRERSHQLKITFFVNSIIGYVNNPAALYTRALANSLTILGNDIRVVEPRQSEPLARTLRTVGAGASRHMYERFPLVQYSTYEPRSGAQLLEWMTREFALIDLAVVVQGADEELTRWAANITREGLSRAFLAWQPEGLTPTMVSDLEIAKFDFICGPAPVADLPWVEVQPTLAEQDVDGAIDLEHAGTGTTTQSSSIDSAAAFIRSLQESTV